MGIAALFSSTILAFLFSGLSTPLKITLPRDMRTWIVGWLATSRNGIVPEPIQKNRNVISCPSRQSLLREAGTFILGTAHLALIQSDRAGAAVPFKSEDLKALEVGLEALNGLLANWDEETLNCNYAEVNSELLSSGRKSDLLAEAKKNALMQKEGTSIRRLCKRDPEKVRITLGLDTRLNAKSGVPSAFAAPGMYKSLNEASRTTSPLVNADRLIRRGLEVIDDKLEEYVAAEEAWLQAISALDSASYASGAADFGAIVSTSANAAGSTADDARFLAEAKRAAVKARDALTIIVDILRNANLQR